MKSTIQTTREGMLARGCALTTLVLACVSLSGCIALALAPLAPTVGGMVSSSNEMELDWTTITPELRQALARAKTLTVLSNDPSITYMAEYLDQKGDYEVRMQEPPKGATPSQRRDLMRKTCAGPERTDLVLSPSAGTSDAGSGVSNAGAMLLGRAIVNQTTSVEVLRCRDNWQNKFSATLKLNQGVFNMDKTKIAEVIGQESAKALLQIAGKLPAPNAPPMDAVAAGTQTEVPQKQAESMAPLPTAAKPVQRPSTNKPPPVTTPQKRPATQQ